MTDAEFRHYIIEQRLQGRSDSQIARSLGMSLRHMIGKLNGVNVDKIDPLVSSGAVMVPDALV